MINHTHATFDVRGFSATNLERCNNWHNINDWSPMEWGAAAAGELGELCNVLKKIKRYDQNIQQNATSQSREVLVSMAAEELADTICYLDLVATSLGIDLTEAVVSKFNAISLRENLPQRLALPEAALGG